MSTAVVTGIGVAAPNGLGVEDYWAATLTGPSGSRPTSQISVRHGMRGPCGVICSEQAGGLDALGQARRLMRGGTRLVVAGGTDSFLCPYGLVAQFGNGGLSTRTDPARAYVPFDVDA